MCSWSCPLHLRWPAGRTPDSRADTGGRGQFWALFMIILYLLGQSDKPLLFADCAVVPQSSLSQWASIAISSNQSYRELLDNGFYVAIHSFSTKESAHHRLREGVKEATELAQEISPQLRPDGELLDATLIPQVAQRKAPQSTVARRANVLIFPDLNSGNISYKLIQRLGGFQAIGPHNPGIHQTSQWPVPGMQRG